MQLSIAGRYLVYVPDGEGVGVSKRLDDKERERLRKAICGALDLGGGGVIVRTAAAGAKDEDFERELAYLHRLSEVLEPRAPRRPAPSLVFQEADLSIRVVRDILGARLRGGHRRRREAVPADRQLPPAHRAGAGRARRALRRATSRCARVRRRGGDPSRRSQRRVDLPVRRLPDHRLRRGADGHRRQHRLLHRPGQRPPRGHDHPDQPRGGRGGRAPAAAARHRRHHRHRLHRHGAAPATATPC